MEMSLSKRQSQILQVLKNSSYEVSGNDLANLLNVTSRTIRNEIKNINSLLEVKCIQSNSQGYFLDCSSEGWMKLIDVEDENIKNQLLRIVLANEVALNVDGLCEQFYMSRKRFMLILDSLKPIMQEFNLTFKVEMNRLYIIGSEFNKRALISSLIYREANNDIANIQTISLFFSDINLNELKTLVNGIVKKYSYYIKDYYGDNLILNLAIAISRMKKGFVLNESCFPDLSWDMDETSFKMVYELKAVLETNYDIVIDAHNVEYLRGLLLGLMKPVYLHNYITQMEQESDTNIYQSMKRILTKTFDYFMLDIDVDDFLINFVIHINAMINRCRLNINVNNLLQYNIQMNCPFVYEVAVFIAVEIEKEFHIRIPDSEIGFIAMHIGFAIESSMESIGKIRIMFLYGNYLNIVEKVSQYIMDKYGDKVEILSQEVCSMQNPADLIVSMIDGPILLADTVQISPFLTPKDKTCVDEAIRKCEKEKTNKIIKKDLIQYFHQNLFFINEKPLSKEECISFLGQQLEDFGVVPSGFTQSVNDREELSSTCFFDHFAIPHSIELNAIKTTIAVMISKVPIKWEEQNVKFIMMLANNKEDRKNFMVLYDGIINLLCDYQNLNYILEAKNYNDFIDIIVKSVN